MGAEECGDEYDCVNNDDAMMCALAHAIGGTDYWCGRLDVSNNAAHRVTFLN